MNSSIDVPNRRTSSKQYIFNSNSFLQNISIVPTSSEHEIRNDEAQVSLVFVWVDSPAAWARRADDSSFIWDSLDFLPNLFDPSS